MSTHRFNDLYSVIDEIHALFDAWDDAGVFTPPLDCDGMIVLRLAVHEWVANLVQHAQFASGAPEITIEIEGTDDGVYVVVEDTSCGFDLLGQIEEQHVILDAPAPSERGRGLLMLITCTEELDYRPASSDRQRLSFHLHNPSSGVFAGLFASSAVSPGPQAFDNLIDGAHGGDGHSSLSTHSQPASR